MGTSEEVREDVKRNLDECPEAVMFNTVHNIQADADKNLVAMIVNFKEYGAH